MSVPQVPAIPTLDRYRAIHAARIEQARAEHEAAQRQKLDKEEAERREQRQKLVALAEHLFGPALVGWEVLTDEHSWHHPYWTIRQAFGEDTVSIRCTCRYTDSGIGSKLNRVDLMAGHRPESAEVWVNFEQPDHAAAEAAIAMVCVNALDTIRDERLAREQREDYEQARDERLDRANARLAELVNIAEGYQAGRLDGLDGKYGWPDGAELTVWKIEWVMGVGEYGDVDRREAFATNAEPAPLDGTYLILAGNRLDRKVITTRNAIEATEVTWRSVADLPCSLRQKVQFERFIRVDTGDGNSVSKYVRREITLPGVAVRQLLGLPTDALENYIRDDACEDADGNVIERGQKNAGGDDEFIPF